MRKRFAILLLVFMMTAVLLPKTAKADAPLELSSVTGSTLADGATYSIGSAAELAQLASLVNGGEDCSGNYFVLTGNITLSGDYDAATDGNWIPIGSGTFNISDGSVSGKAFNGTFYGQNHTVSGLDLRTRDNSAGLFGMIGSAGKVLDLTVAGSFKGANRPTASYTFAPVGGIAGINCGGIYSCTNQAAYTNGTTTEYVLIGGITGVNLGTVQNCVNSASITGYTSTSDRDEDIGGIAGYCREKAQVLNCVNTGSIRGYNAVGGIVGFAAANSPNRVIIRNCYNTGSVAGHEYIGGIVGWLYQEATLENCYTTGSILGGTTESSGAVVGITEMSTVARYCYWLESAFTQGYGSTTRPTISNFASFSSSYSLSNPIYGKDFLIDALQKYFEENPSLPLRIWYNDSSAPDPVLKDVLVLSSPTGCTVSEGDTASFEVLAIDSPTEYHWQVSADGGWSWDDVTTGSGGDTPRYTTGAVTADMDGYQYHCVVDPPSVPNPQASEPATLRLPSVVPEITRQPSDKTAAVGKTATFSVAATGTAPLFYQWQVDRDGSGDWDDIDGATEDSYTTAPVTLLNDGYRYRVVVMNGREVSVTSDPATLHVVNEAVIPTTGDEARPGLWFGAGLLAAALLAAAVRFLWKRRGIRA